jgi:hypothetical protein
MQLNHLAGWLAWRGCGNVAASAQLAAGWHLLSCGCLVQSGCGCGCLAAVVLVAKRLAHRRPEACNTGSA